MKLVIKINELAGKTIKRASSVEHDDKITLIFDDNSFAIVEVDCYGHCEDVSHDLVLANTAHSNLKKEIGD